MAEKLKNLEDLFLDTLKDMYDAEHQVAKALPKMEEAARSKELKQGFKSHLEMTHRQIERLEQIFSEMGVPAERKYCKGMAGLIREGDEAIEEKMEDDVRDAALIAAAQKVEHYEIAGYGTARAFAHALGRSKVAGMLDKIADEEGATDKLLTGMAETNINRRAIN